MGERLDLCRDCSSLFTNWFMRRPAATAPLRDRVRSTATAAASGAFGKLFKD
jgi:hypothetical protein